MWINVENMDEKSEIDEIDGQQPNLALIDLIER